MEFDVIVIGGSYAGLAAATPLARARRRVLVVDGGMRRNRYAEHSHGFLTQDGTPAAEIAAIGRAQLLRYPTVSWYEKNVTHAQKIEGGFAITVDGLPTQTARRLVLATGVVDRLPDIAGLAERWGQHVFHCPYCHGYELNQGRIGLLASSAQAMHLAQLLPDWGPTTLLLNDTFEPDELQRDALRRRGVTVERGLVDHIENAMDVVMKDGRTLTFEGLFAMTSPYCAGSLATLLGCAFEEGPMGRTIRTDALKATTVPGVYACGDAARPGGSVPLAVGDGSLAGAAAHQSLIFAPHLDR